MYKHKSTRAQATGVETKTAETVSPGSYKDGHIEILSNYKIEKSVQILKKNPCYNETFGENIEKPTWSRKDELQKLVVSIEDSSVETDEGKKRFKIQ